LIEWHPLPFSQGGSIADWQASGQGLAAVRDVSVAEVAFGSFTSILALSTDVRFPSNTDRKFSALGFVAMCHEATYAMQQIWSLFDHFICEQQE
jgi:hypothetical protein